MMNQQVAGMGMMGGVGGVPQGQMNPNNMQANMPGSGMIRPQQQQQQQQQMNQMNPQMAQQNQVVGNMPPQMNPQMGQMQGMPQMGQNIPPQVKPVGPMMNPIQQQMNVQNPMNTGMQNVPMMNQQQQQQMMPNNPAIMMGVRPGMAPNPMMGMNPGVPQNVPIMNPMQVQQQQQMNPNQLMNIQMRKQEMMTGGPPGGPFPQVRSVTPNFLRQSPSPMSVPSPIGLSQSQHGSGSGGMVASPAMVPSPQAPLSNQPGSRGGMQNVMAPSPSANMNTPGQPTAVQSPMNPQDDHLYREKYNRLTKYKEPLKKMISRVGADGINSEKITKLKKLLEILSNPDARIPLETLVKCEIVLENQFGALKDPPASINNPLYDAIANNLQSPLASHTLQRTFKPSIEAWFGPDIKNLPPAKKRRVSEDQVVPTGPNEIPHLLQGEIARLDQKFKIQLDQTSQMAGSKSIKLICTMDDRHLPCVPPISVSIPEDYPQTSPHVSIVEHEYDDTAFLLEVRKALKARVAKLPAKFSLTHILETWGLAIRQACNTESYVEPTAASVLMAV